jgi:hypothetical protein
MGREKKEGGRGGATDAAAAADAVAVRKSGRVRRSYR